MESRFTFQLFLQFAREWLATWNSTSPRLSPVDQLIAVRRRLQNPYWALHERCHYMWKNFLLTLMRDIPAWIWRKSNLSHWIYVKQTWPGLARMEYENMRFLCESTNIPIPRPICWFNVPFGPDEVQWGYLLTSRMPGRPLSESWLSLSHADKCVIIQQLATYMRQLRSIPPPPNPLIGSVAGRPVRCFRLTALNPVGPFHDEEHLNRHLRGPRSSQMPLTVMQTHAKRHALVFSHNDLFPKNILVEGTKITAIVDWESSGWFPAHFEYCCQKYAVCDDFDADWASFVPEFLDEWEEEVQADEAIKKVYESFRVTWDTVE